MLNRHNCASNNMNAFDVYKSFQFIFHTINHQGIYNYIFSDYYEFG